MKKGLKLLTCGVICMSAFAWKANAEEKSVKIGDAEYATLKDAVEAVEVCTTETCETTTINVVDDHTTSGIKFESGKYITIDLGGYTVTFDAPTVGSKGTETQDMQILKNSTITFKNGKMVSSDTERSKMFIQNYANLTLEDVEIVAMNELNLYAVSNNSGDVNILGTTSIKAKRVAFDVCGYSTYTIGPKVVVNTTGTIEGDIEVTKDATAANERPLSLVIENANHIGNISIQEGLESNVTIKKGTYTDEVAKDVIESEDGSNAYEVINKDGETQYVVATEEEVEEAPYESGEAMSSEEVKTGLADIEKYLKETNKDELDEEEKEAYELLENFVNEFNKILGNKVIVSSHDILYGSFINKDLIVGKENNQPEEGTKVKVSLNIPTTLEKVKDGYTRKYSAIRLHINEDGTIEVKELAAKDNADGTVTFETDKFSTYVLAYEDIENTKNPTTGDNTLVYFATAIISVIGLMLTTLKITKKQK